MNSDGTEQQRALPDTLIADTLFEYLRIIIFSPEKPPLNLDGLPAAYQKLIEGMRFLHECIFELRSFANALAKGNINTNLPKVENGLAAPLMALHGTLTHLTWQARQVAKGDYGQHLDFMGEFGDYFNQMVAQLKERNDALVVERKLVAEKEEALEQASALLLDLIMRIPQGVVVIDPQTGKRLFINRTASRFLQSNSKLCEQITEELVGKAFPFGTKEKWEMNFPLTDELGNTVKNKYFFVYSYCVPWSGSYAVSHIISDKTVEKENERVMQELSFKDELTGMFNRRYAMETLNEWVAEGRSFCIAFVDIDYLKYFNDTYGHHEGDSYILLVVDMLVNIPDETLVCRIGGDEFMLLKEGVSIGEFEVMLNEQREKLLAYDFPGEKKHRRSFSYGISQIDKNFQGSLSEIMSEADQKMYQFKFANKKILQSEKDGHG